MGGDHCAGEFSGVDDCVGGGGVGVAGGGAAGGTWAIMGCGSYVYIAEY